MPENFSKSVICATSTSQSGGIRSVAVSAMPTLLRKENATTPFLQSAEAQRPSIALKI